MMRGVAVKIMQVGPELKMRAPDATAYVHQDANPAIQLLVGTAAIPQALKELGATL